MLEIPWLQEVDWLKWMDSSKALPDDHPTIAGQVPAEETIHKLANQKHSKLLIEIRTRGYSIRTEQAYKPWVARFIAFCNNEQKGGQAFIT